MSPPLHKLGRDAFLPFLLFLQLEELFPHAKLQDARRRNRLDAVFAQRGRDFVVLQIPPCLVERKPASRSHVGEFLLHGPDLGCLDRIQT